MRAVEMFFALLKNCLFGVPLPASLAQSITDEKLALIYKSARGHDVAQMIASSLFENSIELSAEYKEKLKDQQLLAIYRYQCMKSEIEKISALFEEENIPFIPLKGAIIRELYPEPYLRTSCDIDILVHESDVERAVGLLTEKMGYISGVRNYHDYSLHSPTGVHLELHFNILENMENIDRLLSRAWEFAIPCEGSCRYNFTNEFVVFYAISHMSYHFATGGCGIRPFIDLYFMEKKIGFDRGVLQKMLLECNLVKFYDSVNRLCLVWFEGEEHDEITREMERFILTGGVNGSRKKGIVAKQLKKGGKNAYILERIFQPYGIMKEKYPILKKHKYLLPFYQVKRWFSLSHRGKLSKLKKEYNADKSINFEQAKEMNIFLSKLGIK